ncbi:MAG: hypothetical protein PHG63_04140, partial [Candidatus Dojkabacteria bacterium]|nr:hypothetical protein [Candidatus Dojkabacteria bacterium]
MSDTVTTLGLETVPGDYTITERSPLLEARERKRIEAILGSPLSESPVSSIRIPITLFDNVFTLIRVISSAVHYRNVGSQYIIGCQPLLPDQYPYFDSFNDIQLVVNLFRREKRYLEVAVVEVEDTGEEVPDVELPENEPAGGPAKRFRAILGVSGTLDQKALEGDDRREVGQETAIAFA